MRHPLVIGNWKLNGNRQMIKKVVALLRKELLNISNCFVVIAPPAVYLDLTKQIIGNSSIMLGAQNVDINLFGPFTGETSAKMIKDIGVKYIIIGHSERRIHHGESDEYIAKKFAIVKEQNLIPVLCIGETEEEKQTNKIKQVCKRQINAILNIQNVTAFKNVVIAYEPVWAIGSGKSATPLQVQEVHKFIRNYFARIDKKIAEQIIIQYGGSINAENAKEFLDQPDIDGVLVGNASLDPTSFIKIVKIAINSKTVIKNHTISSFNNN